MSLNNIHESAIFIADSHFNQNRNELLIFLQKLLNKEIITKQLFLMGDMIDFISGESKYFIKRSKEVIELINELSNKMEVYYLEGNHDYNLKELFPKVKVYKRENQPVFLDYNSKKVALAHGDIYVPGKSYDYYCKFIRNTYFLNFMNFIDIKNIISKKIYYSLLEKNICRKIGHFEQIVENRVKNYDADIIIEGHFHQGSEFLKDGKTYKNIPSLTCEKKYVRLEDEKFLTFEI